MQLSSTSCRHCACSVIEQSLTLWMLPTRYPRPATSCSCCAVMCCCLRWYQQSGAGATAAAASLGGSSRKALRLHPLLEGHEHQLDSDYQVQQPTAQQLSAMLQPGGSCEGEAAAAACAAAVAAAVQRQARSAPNSPDGHRALNRSASAHVRASVACDSTRSPVLQVR
jgi:hypothetical protein